jgi:hypothetical protein
MVAVAELVILMSTALTGVGEAYHSNVVKAMKRNTARAILYIDFCVSDILGIENLLLLSAFSFPFI